MWKKIKRFNWTFLITWTIIFYVGYKIWSGLLSLV